MDELSVNKWIEENSEKVLINENKNSYEFKYCDIQYYIQPKKYEPSCLN